MPYDRFACQLVEGLAHPPFLKKEPKVEKNPEKRRGIPWGSA